MELFIPTHVSGSGYSRSSSDLGENKVILPDRNLGCWLERKTLEDYPMPTAYRKIARQLKTSD